MKLEGTERDLGKIVSVILALLVLIEVVAVAVAVVVVVITVHGLIPHIIPQRVLLIITIPLYKP